MLISPSFPSLLPFISVLFLCSTSSCCPCYPHSLPSSSLPQPFGNSQSVSSSDSAESSGSSSKPHSSSDGRHYARKSGPKKRNHSRSRSNSPTPENGKRRRYSNGSGAETRGEEGDRRAGEPSVFTFDTSQLHPSHRVMPPPPLAAMHDAGTMTSQGGKGQRNATLDDLCRAVEALEKMENGNRDDVHSPPKDLSDEDDKRRPGNIHIPTHTSPQLDRDRHKLGSTPPYTPPPILSPARSMTMLATPGTPGGPSCGTPSRILQPWSCRRTSDHRKPSEVEDGYPEPKINVGRHFQAVLPTCDGKREEGGEGREGRGRRGGGEGGEGRGGEGRYLYI